jgi:hypothetical protein
MLPADLQALVESTTRGGSRIAVVVDLVAGLTRDHRDPRKLARRLAKCVEAPVFQSTYVRRRRGFLIGDH